MQVEAISLCKLRIFPLPFSKKDKRFKAFALRAQGYYEQKTQGDCPGL